MNYDDIEEQVRVCLGGVVVVAEEEHGRMAKHIVAGAAARWIRQVLPFRAPETTADDADSDDAMGTVAAVGEEG